MYPARAFSSSRQRREASRQPGQLALARLQIVRLPLELDARRGQLGLARGPRVQRCLGRLPRAAQAVGRRRAIAFEPLPLHPDFGFLDAQLGELFRDALRRFLGVLNRVARASSRHSAPKTPQTAPPRRRPRALRCGDAPRRTRVSIRSSSLRRAPADRAAPSPAASVRSTKSGRPGSRRASSAASSLRTSSRPQPEPVDLLPVELDLLLPAVDVELAGVHGLARAVVAFASDSTSEMRMRLKSASAAPTAAEAPDSRRRASSSRRAQRFDLLRGVPVPAGEQQLLPVPQLIAQPLVPARLRRLALQRSELLLELEDDVFEPGQVELRRLELELGRPAAGLVLGDAGRFLDQLPPIGRAAC